MGAELRSEVDEAGLVERADEVGGLEQDPLHRRRVAGIGAASDSLETAVPELGVTFSTPSTVTVLASGGRPRSTCSAT